MRIAVILGLAATACAPTAGPTANTDGMAVIDNAADAMPPDPLRACDGSKADALLGRAVDAALRAEAMRMVGAASTRVIAPGAMVTMDYRSNRLNIETDSANKATSFRCG